MIGVIISGVQIATVAALFWIGRLNSRALRLSLRREAVLVRLMNLYDALLEQACKGTLTQDELELGANRINLALADELHAQQHVGHWRRVPRIGEEWSDDLLAPLLDD